MEKNAPIAQLNSSQLAKMIKREEFWAAFLGVHCPHPMENSPIFFFHFYFTESHWPIPLHPFEGVKFFCNPIHFGQQQKQQKKCEKNSRGLLAIGRRRILRERAIGHQKIRQRVDSGL